jgi:hypothetical protein
MKTERVLSKKTIKSITIGGKRIKIGKDSLISTEGGSFDELIKGLRKISKKNTFEAI